MSNLSRSRRLLDRWSSTYLDREKLSKFVGPPLFEDSAHHIAFTEYRMAVHFRTECVERLESALRAEVQSWRSLPVIKALMTLRAIDFLSATTIVAELGDLRRFPHPRDLMGYLGLVPSEHSSAPRNTVANSPEPAIPTCVVF